MKTYTKKQTFTSNAKLMITGEYLVLRGAESLAIPLKFGQTLRVIEHEGTPQLSWKTIVKSQHWFDAVFSLNEFVIGNSNDFPTAQNIRGILLAAKSLNPEFLSNDRRYEIITELDFDINWGLGSSSSLIVNVSNWAGVNPYELLAKVSSGSGYDVAAASSDRPILYTLKDNSRVVEKIDFYPDFHNNLYFAYLGSKKKSSQAVSTFSESNHKDYSAEILQINVITRSLASSNELREFRKLIREHEKIMSRVLGIPACGNKLFSDFNGDVKSLGAWGGDFVMLATDMPFEYVSTYLRKKEMNVWFRYQDIAK